jgi:hypothetical protein
LEDAEGMDVEAVARFTDASHAELKCFSSNGESLRALELQTKRGNLNWKMPKQQPLSLKNFSRLILKGYDVFLLDGVVTSFGTAWALAGGLSPKT